MLNAIIMIPNSQRTRASNASTHPGEHHTKYDRRTTAEVETERHSKSNKKARKESVAQKGAVRAAELERDARKRAAALGQRPGTLGRSQVPIPFVRQEKVTEMASFELLVPKEIHKSHQC